MASHCNDCIKGTIHKGQPQGKIETIHGLNTYVIGNRTNPRGIVVIYSDVFSHNLPNNKIIADAYAKSGQWLVYLPDFFQGDPMAIKGADLLIPVDASKQSALAKYTGLLASAPQFLMWQSRHKDGPTNKVCMDFLQALRRETTGTKKIGIVGFCWGGRYAVRAGLERNMIEMDGKRVPLVDAVVALHPSNMVLPGDVQDPVVPMSCAWGEHDQLVKLEQKKQMEDVHAKAKAAGKTIPEIEHLIYRPGRHGFAVRGDPDDPQERACLEGTEKQGLEWMERWL